MYKTDANVRVGVATCTPIPMVEGPSGRRLAPITAEWHRAKSSLFLPTNFNQIALQVDGKGVDEARTLAVEMALDTETPPEFLFFLDYDVITPPDAFVKLHFRARCFPDYDIFAGVYCVKGEGVNDPLIYKAFGEGPHWDWALGDLLLDGILAVHMGLTIIRMSLFEKLEWTSPDGDNPLFKTSQEFGVQAGMLVTNRGSEDIFFCKKAGEEADAKILVDTSVLAGHINNATGVIYGLPPDCPPVQKSHWMKRRNQDPAFIALRELLNQKDSLQIKVEHQEVWEKAQKLVDSEDRKEEGGLLRALDIGAGSERRQWNGYKTYTTDIRPNVDADYMMDTRLLNFPDEEFDLVASSHHLEHIPRWEQKSVWMEMARILKPGGMMEHILPNLEWAAEKITNDETDGDVYNVLYGAQEAHEYERDLNTHYFGYTPKVAVAFAELAGLVDVEVKTFKDDPNLGYNLVLTAGKPKVDEEEQQEATLEDSDSGSVC